MWALFSRRELPDLRALADCARVTIGAAARVDALARLFALFPDEPAIAVVDGAGVPIGVVTPDRLDPGTRGVVADLMLALA
jgi:hypothetical protein